MAVLGRPATGWLPQRGHHEHRSARTDQIWSRAAGHRHLIPHPKGRRTRTGQRITSLIGLQDPTVRSETFNHHPGNGDLRRLRAARGHRISLATDQARRDTGQRLCRHRQPGPRPRRSGRRRTRRHRPGSNSRAGSHTAHQHRKGAPNDGKPANTPPHPRMHPARLAHTPQDGSPARTVAITPALTADTTARPIVAHLH